MTFLEFLVVLPLIIACILIFIPSRAYRLVKVVSLYGSFGVLVVSLILFFKYDRNFIGFQFVSNREIFQSINVYYSLGIDGISLLFLTLTALIIPLCILCSWTTIERRVKEFMILLFFNRIFYCLMFFFCFRFYYYFTFFFESILIPMFFIIGVWGSRERRIHAVLPIFSVYTGRLCFNVTRYFISVL